MANNPFVPSTTTGGLMRRRTQTFTSSGTFYPTQAMLDAGGLLDIDLRGGGGGHGFISEAGGCGGDSRHVTTYQLTSLAPITVTIGAGGTGSNSSTGTAGGASSFGTLTVNGGFQGIAGACPGYGAGNMGRAGQPTFFTSNSGFSGAFKLAGQLNNLDYGAGGGQASLNGVGGCCIVTWWEKI